MDRKITFGPVPSGASIPLSSLSFMQELGSGSSGVVSLAAFNGQFVAVKTLSDIDDEAAAETLRREAEILSKIKDSTNIVKIIGVFESDSAAGIVMEFCPQGSLNNYLKSQRNIDEYEIFKLAYGIANGMICLAEASIVHRDLAARNVLLNEQLFPKVSDLGLAKTNSKYKTVKILQTEKALGPVRCQAPELLRGEEYSQASDVWAFGATLVEIATCGLPFADYKGSILQLAMDIRDNALDPLKNLSQSQVEMIPPWVLPRARRNIIS
eukprot:TRINITY_DN12499_c0_g1_i1.p1 TRINITY_DN12499_c0_g1~~TRINITY_DN12499_c0_g1_i1.p1  ORF type:complete len:268 (-),score=26.28 TRINITY_DN12499_c0_g1_i1:72-875(-)